MTNLEKYTQVFCDIFGVTKEVAEGLEYQTISAWDSVGHMALFVALEDAFDIMLDPHDIIDINSFEKGKEILKKYDVEIG